MTDPTRLAGPTSHSFMSQRLKLHYAAWGNPEAPPLLLLHGGRDHCRSWDWVAQRLADRYHIICPDLRGHGDSAWSPDGDYSMASYLYDLAQVIHQLKLAPLSIIAHSLGGNIALRYTGLYPENVSRIVAIEGLGPSPRMIAEREKTPFSDRLRGWIDEKRQAAGRQPRRYPTLEEALERMKSENTYLTDEQARHLTAHGVSQNEDGTFSWKFDNYLRVWSAPDISHEQVAELWRAIRCPTLLCYGEKSWASNPEKDGRAALFQDARTVSFPDAGHWLHHDRFEMFMDEVERFLDGGQPAN
ncbi:MAG: alpha/beta fold hydrolase [Caulobacter sp.]|nr:alpha/beta fold hydrolase [Caulobacter sp.]